jgi:hypothetical protein
MYNILYWQRQRVCDAFLNKEPSQGGKGRTKRENPSEPKWEPKVHKPKGSQREERKKLLQSSHQSPEAHPRKKEKET